MGRKLLIYRWGSLNEPLFCKAVQNMGWDYKEFACKMNNYHADASFAKKLIEYIHAEKIQVVFSYDYFPLISMICEINKIPYISWIYDCPQYTLQSGTIRNHYNYIFCFDRIYTERLKVMGAVHCYHFPLAVTINMQKSKPENVKKYQCDISFVGNLYNGKNNRLRQAKLTPYVQGYVEGMIQAQLRVYGYNFLKEVLPETVCNEIVQKCDLRLSEECMQDEMQLAVDAIGMEVTGREREMVLCEIGRYYPVKLYTSSDLPSNFQMSNIQKMGFADYETEVPLIFHTSKINLNITSKTIESGIPQRVFDIMSCGGFCLTNYQPEIAEYFADGQDLVMYTDIADLLD